jgi:carbamoyltransferase
MWTLGLNRSHDASITLMKDNEVVLHLQEERLSHNKHTSELVYLSEIIKNYTTKIDHAAYTFLHNEVSDFGPYHALLEKNGVEVKEWHNFSNMHHELHCTCAFYNSGFNSAVCLVIDGAGSDKDYGKENESIFDINSYKEFDCVYKTCVGFGQIETLDIPHYVDRNQRIGVGMVYAAVTEYLGWDGLDCGKTMGLSSYGTEDAKIKSMLNSLGGDCKIFGLYDWQNLKMVGAKIKSYDYLSYSKNKEDTERKRQNLAYKLQKEFELYILELVYKAILITGKTNIILTGGCALNCVSNYRLLKNLPKNVNLYIEPISDDSAVSMGTAKYLYYKSQSEKLIPNYKDVSLNTLYLGQQIDYTYQLKKGEIEKDIIPQDIAQLIVDGNIVAICQGRSEAGPRALGNRSILFDPRVKNGKDIVNNIKKREYFRPFAGTVLLEYAKEWFDMNRLEESPHMMYAVDVLEDKMNLIPSITHVDGTCRIQTLKKEYNPNYYNLIEEFYKLTGVPILFNTSFNLAGDTIVETIDDAFNTLRNSEIEYMYLPEISKLIYVPNEKNLC